MEVSRPANLGNMVSERQVAEKKIKGPRNKTIKLRHVINKVCESLTMSLYRNYTVVNKIMQASLLTEK